MNAISLPRTPLGAVIALAFTAAPASAHVPFTFEHVMVDSLVPKTSFQGGCSRGTDACLR